MDPTIRVTIRVRKYLWSEFVHDVCFILYATIMISNALSKRYLKLSLRQLYHLMVRVIKWAFWAIMIVFWSGLFINAFIQEFK